jgi:hypothetical protein
MPKWPDHETAKGTLPPPPAPVARDANPWPMPARQGDAARARVRQPRAGLPAQLGPISPSSGVMRPAPTQVPPGRSPPPTPVAGPRNKPSAPTGQPGAESRPAITRFVPFAIFLAVLGSIASTAIEALGRGDRIGAVIPLIVVGIIAVGWWRAMRRQRRQ